MEKCLNIPVLDANGTNSQAQMVSISGISSIGQPTTTSVTIKYLGGKVTTLTWPSASATASPGLQVSVQDAIVAALTKGWTNVSEPYQPKGMLSGMSVNYQLEAGSFLNVNPLSAIAIA